MDISPQPRGEFKLAPSDSEEDLVPHLRPTEMDSYTSDLGRDYSTSLHRTLDYAVSHPTGTTRVCIRQRLTNAKKIIGKRMLKKTHWQSSPRDPLYLRSVHTYGTGGARCVEHDLELFRRERLSGVPSLHKDWAGPHDVCACDRCVPPDTGPIAGIAAFTAFGTTTPLVHHSPGTSATSDVPTPTTLSRTRGTRGGRLSLRCRYR